MSELTSRQRMLRALNLQEPDHIPCCFMSFSALRKHHAENRFEVVEAPVVDSDGTVTSGGVSYCIDATLYLVRRFCGDKVADETARIIEFDPQLRAQHFAVEQTHRKSG